MTGHDATRWGLHEPDHYDRVLLTLRAVRAACARQGEGARPLEADVPSSCLGVNMPCFAPPLEPVNQGRIVCDLCLSRLENDGVVERLLKRKGDQCVKWQTSFPEPFVEATEHGWRILPDHSDGWGQHVLEHFAKANLSHAFSRCSFSVTLDYSPTGFKGAGDRCWFCQ